MRDNYPFLLVERMEFPSFNRIWWLKDVLEQINDERPRSVQNVIDIGVKEYDELTKGRSPWPFYCCYLLPLIYLCTLYFGGYATFLIPILMYFLTPLLEVALGDDPGGAIVPDARFNMALYLWIIPHMLTLMISAWVIDRMSFIEIVGMILSSGTIIGSVGITVAHELVHRNSSNIKLIGQILTMSMFYGHFYFSHVFGHHANLCTENDPNTARKNETIHRFLYRSISGGYLQAWEIANKFKRGNILCFYHMVQIIYIWFILSWFGWLALLYVVLSSIVAILLLESINYVEHYGLTRERGSRITEHHSWNTNKEVTNTLLFRIQRHSGHHENSKTEYPELVVRDDAPQLPAGYGGCLILAHIPYLWFKIMNPRLEALPANRKKLF